MSKKGSKASRYLKAPMKILIKAREFYIKSMTEYWNQIGYGSVMGCPTPTGQLNTLPRSSSASVFPTRQSSSDGNWKKLIRAASTSRLGNNVQLEILKPQQARQSPRTRNHSLGIGRIDEDKPCEFEEDDFKVKTDVFPRSRRLAVLNL
ncbi:hypothetical protein V6N13_112223 [Hibiscus sabdariffa]|uniref:Uncharacterized protein n=1 Tax=Hibiscus sabdariffa TaxID=183260 RepID=A0ABR2TNG4_9ROSI